jgi:hypothetical protein
LSKSAVKIANYPEDIVANDTQINDPDFLGNKLDYKNDDRRYYLDDATWFNGSIINYTLINCPACGNKLKVINHV